MKHAILMFCSLISLAGLWLMLSAVTKRDTRNLKKHGWKFMTFVSYWNYSEEDKFTKKEWKEALIGLTLFLFGVLIFFICQAVVIELF